MIKSQTTVLKFLQNSGDSSCISIEKDKRIGHEKRIREMIKKMKQNGFTPEQIALVTEGNLEVSD